MDPEFSTICGITKEELDTIIYDKYGDRYHLGKGILFFSEKWKVKSEKSRWRSWENLKPKNVYSFPLTGG